MDISTEANSAVTATIPNGGGAAAILAAGIGCFAVGLFAAMADKSPIVRSFFVFYKPTGALSGVTSTAIAAWLISWVVLARRWRKRDVRMLRVNIWAFILLGFSVLLTFPPFVDLF